MTLHGWLLPVLHVLLLHSCIQPSLCRLSSQCRSTQSTRLVIHSTKNNTGHWIAKVAIENPEAYGLTTAEGVLGPEHWKIELDHHSGGCGIKESFSTIITIPPPQPTPGYELFEGIGYYKFHTRPKIWTEALHVCEQEGGHLAIINSEEEASILKKLFERHGRIHGADFENVVGIGFHDRFVEGEYLTVFDDPLATTGFMRWTTWDRPDDWQGSDSNPVDDCGSIASDGGLKTIACDARIAFICEKEL